MVNLVDLPVDILLSIFSCLESRWVMSLRQCCRLLCEVTRDRGLWLDLFRQTAKAHQVLPSSFRPDSMSLEELEKAALKPHQFVSLLLNHTGDELMPTRCWKSSLLSPGTVEDPVIAVEPDLWRFTDVQMVFGGRFVFSVYGGRVVFLWDFETDSDDFPSPTAYISAVSLGLKEDERIVTKACTAAPDGCSLYLELIISDESFENSSHGRRTQICKVDPFAAPESVFVPFASREHYGRYDTVLRGTNLVILGRRNISVWDFETDQSISWKTGSTNDRTLFCINNYCTLIHYTEGKYKIWEIPPMADDLKGHVKILNEPKCTGDILQELNARPGKYLDIVEPKCHSTAPALLTFVEDYPWDRAAASPYEILETHVVSIEENPRAGLEGESPLVFTLTPYSEIKAPDNSRMFSTHYVTEDAQIVSLARFMPGISLHVRARDHTSSGADDRLAFKNNTVRLMPTPSLDVQFFDICPFSARCAVVTGGGGFHVYEYL